MYFIIHQSLLNGNITIVADCADHDQAIQLLKRKALEFIKEEDGIKKADSKPFLTREVLIGAVQDITIKPGHYLLLGDNTIEVHKKEHLVSRGYFGGASLTSSMQHSGTYRVVSYKQHVRVTTTVCKDCNKTIVTSNRDSHRYSMDRNGVYSSLINDMQNSSFFLRMQEKDKEYQRGCEIEAQLSSVAEAVAESVLTEVLAEVEALPEADVESVLAKVDDYIEDCNEEWVPDDEWSPDEEWNPFEIKN